MCDPPLRLEEIRNAMLGRLIGREIQVLETTRSTNDAILEGITKETAAGVVVFAETQTAGRGQRGNVWESAARKGLWFSVLLRPQIPLTDSIQLTFWAARCVCQILFQFGIEGIIKAPNDILVGNRKIAGVLIEMRAQPRAPHIAIVGIGINVNHSPQDFSAAIRDRATSFAIIRGCEIDRTTIAISLLRSLDDAYRR
jgi:BirA family transcriptional regulator, biotin operon repressor / biotin---[acetyl-CoA-carboxylase] ligase